MVKIIQIETIEEENDLIEFLKTGTYPEGLNKIQKYRFKAKASNFVFINDTLCLKKPDGSLLRAVFDFETELVRLILEEEHRIGHPGMNEMINFIHRKYFGISSLVIREFVKSCDACTRYSGVQNCPDDKIF